MYPIHSWDWMLMQYEADILVQLRYYSNETNNYFIELVFMNFFRFSFFVICWNSTYYVCTQCRGPVDINNQFFPERLSETEKHQTGDYLVEELTEQIWYFTYTFFTIVEIYRPSTIPSRYQFNIFAGYITILEIEKNLCEMISRNIKLPNLKIR